MNQKSEINTDLMIVMVCKNNADVNFLREVARRIDTPSITFSEAINSLSTGGPQDEN
jgi:spore germination protein GerM